MTDTSKSFARETLDELWRFWAKTAREIAAKNTNLSAQLSAANARADHARDAALVEAADRLKSVYRVSITRIGGVDVYGADAGSPASCYHTILALRDKPAETVPQPDLCSTSEPQLHNVDPDDGFWRSCSGCHETSDGQETGNYPYSPTFKCYMGAGCSECGGLGATWDSTNYADMAEDMQDKPAPAVTVDIDALAYRFWSIHPKDIPDPVGMPEGYKGGARAWMYATEIREVIRAIAGGGDE